MSNEYLVHYRKLSKEHSNLLNFFRTLSSVIILFAHALWVFLLPRYGYKGKFFLDTYGFFRQKRSVIFSILAIADLWKIFWIRKQKVKEQRKKLPLTESLYSPIQAHGLSSTTPIKSLWKASRMKEK